MSEARIYLTPDAGYMHWCQWCGHCIKGSGLTLFTMAAAEHFAGHADRTDDEIEAAMRTLGQGVTK